MNKLWDLEWALVDEHDGLRLFQAGQTWAVCRPGVEPGDAESGLTGSAGIAQRWFDDLKEEA